MINIHKHCELERTVHQLSCVGASHGITQKKSSELDLSISQSLIKRLQSRQTPSFQDATADDRKSKGKGELGGDRGTVVASEVR